MLAGKGARVFFQWMAVARGVLSLASLILYQGIHVRYDESGLKLSAFVLCNFKPAESYRFINSK